MRITGQEYRFYQGTVDGSVESISLSESDFDVDDGQRLLVKGDEVSPRGVKDISRILRIPKHLLLESSVSTMRKLVAERLRFEEVRNLTSARFDKKFVLFTETSPEEYRSPALALPEELEKEFVVWTDVEETDLVRIWIPEERFQFEENDFEVGVRVMAGTTTKSFMEAEQRLEKVICKNGLMGLIQTSGTSRVDTNLSEEVLSTFFEEQRGITPLFAENAKRVFKEMAQTGVTDIDDAVFFAFERGAMTTRARKKVSTVLPSFLDPENEEERLAAGVDGPMHTALDMVQAISFIAKGYSDSQREKLEKSVGKFIMREFAETPQEDRGKVWVQVA